MPPAARPLTEETLRTRNAALDSISQGVIITDGRLRIVYANEAFLALTGFARDEVEGRNCRFLQGPLSDPGVIACIRQAVAARTEFKGEILNYRKDGSLFWNELSISPVPGSTGEVTHFIGTSRDVSERVQAQRALRDSEQRLQLALLGGSLGLWDWRYQDGTLEVNARWMEMLGLDPRGPRQGIADWTARVHPQDQLVLARLVQDVILNPQGHAFEAEVRARHELGHWVWILDKGAVVERAADGSPIRVAGTHMDISERKRAEVELQRLAYSDMLTGLPNRQRLLDRLTLALASARRSGRFSAVLFIDLDNFKQINDARGHSIGDTLLQQVAGRITALLRVEDLAARVGGDEFVVLAGNLGSDIDAAARAAMAVAEKLVAALESPYHVDGQAYSSSGSVGVTVFPKRDESVDDLLREADTAMYRAKAAGRNRIAFFQPDMQAEAEAQLALEHDFKRAVAEQQLAVHVQTLVDARGTPVGGELLLRWRHPQRGEVSPCCFIPLAEASGLIVRLGEWVLRQACEALVRLRQAGPGLVLSVNVSPRQFRHDGFVRHVRALLQETGAPASGLVFEITEGLLIDKLDETIARMAELVALGIRISIDDFGTGYSSLAYLRTLPLYELKIDRSFVRDIPGDPAIVEAVLALAQHLKLRVVAEGVETRAQADFLAARGCDCLQGFLFARPQPLADWLASVTAEIDQGEQRQAGFAQLG